MDDRTNCPSCDSHLLLYSQNYCHFCGQTLTGSLGNIPEPDQPSDGIQDPSRMFFANAHLGLTGWWRWILGSILIYSIWMGIGAIPSLAACHYLMINQIPQFACENGQIIGDSLIPGYIASNYPFIIGIIGVWLTVKLLHRKSLTSIITGRRSFDYNRVLYAVWIGLVLQFVLLVFDSTFFHTGLIFRAPDFWEYITFFMFAIVLTPYQAAMEEVFFRGYLTQGLSLIVKSKIFLVALPSLLFSAGHLSNPEAAGLGLFPYISWLFIFAVFSSLLTLLDGGIELAVGYHSLNNLWVGLVINSEVSSLTTPSLFIMPFTELMYFPDIAFQTITYLTVFFIFRRKYQWQKRM